MSGNKSGKYRRCGKAALPPLIAAEDIMGKKNMYLGIACAVFAVASAAACLFGQTPMAVTFALCAGIDGFFAGWGRYSNTGREEGE